MTDGEPTDNTHNDVRNRIRSLIENRKLTFFPIGIGNGANLEVLEDLSPKRKPLRLKGLHFQEFFEWLSSSVSTVSNSMPGESVQLDVEGLSGWAEL